MRFDQDRLDGDPSYAPGIAKASGLFYWKPSAAFVKQGYSKQIYRLPGKEGDDLHLERALQCRIYARAMLRWTNDEGPKAEPGTWRWLIGRYKSDDYSPFQEVKDNTRTDYRYHLARWEAGIGDVRVADTDLPSIKRWQNAMRERGKSVHYIKAMFTKLRIVTGYGVQIKVDGARDVRDILSEMRIRTPKGRKISASEAHILAVVQQADAAGYHNFATGLLFQWWLTLRAVDVRGQWLGSGAQKRWADGLTWDMIDKDMTTLLKVPSKTEDSAPDVLRFDLTLIPQLRARLQAIPADQRVGPVIKDATGKPYENGRWPKMWRRFADAAGVPAEVQALDIRAGAINHAKRAGASMEDRQRQANHASPEMTERYTREHDDVRNRVIQLRTRTP
jgi:hypothetical protein